MKVWAVFGNPDKTEDVVDHLMDCGKTAIVVWPGVEVEGHMFRSFEPLRNHPKLARPEVALFMEQAGSLSKVAAEAISVGVHGILLQAGVSWNSTHVAGASAQGVPLHVADMFEVVQPGMNGLPIAPID
eukprot:6466712-Amphidinium_carterae.1